MSPDLESVLAALDQEEAQPCYLVAGDRVLAEPAAVRLGEALARRFDCEPEVHRRPARLTDLLADLRTFSLFAPAKVIVAVETAVLADAGAAASLLEEAIAALPVESGGDLAGRDRQAAIRLLQVLRLLQIDPGAGAPEGVLAAVPDAVFAGRTRGSRRRRRPKGEIARLRQELAPLLEAARGAGLEGWGDSEVEAVADVVRDGLPRGHCLVLAESSVARDHPLAAALAERDCLVEVGRVESERGRGWSGLERLAGELERQTGAAISGEARTELARRTLRRAGGWGDKTIDADTTARFAAEYRKLAEISGGEPIDRSLVESSVEDRGEEDVWGILDEIGRGRGEEAMRRLRRLQSSAEDPVAARLSFFALLAGYCRQLTAVAGMLERGDVPRGVKSFGRFKEKVAPLLQRDLAGGRRNPLAGLHPFRLHRAYLAASRLASDRLAELPGRLLETELRLKGESRSPDAALAALVLELAAPGRR